MTRLLAPQTIRSHSPTPRPAGSSSPGARAATSTAGRSLPPSTAAPLGCNAPCRLAVQSCLPIGQMAGLWAAPIIRCFCAPRTAVTLGQSSRCRRRPCQTDSRRVPIRPSLLLTGAPDGWPCWWTGRRANSSSGSSPPTAVTSGSWTRSSPLPLPSAGRCHWPLPTCGSGSMTKTGQPLLPTSGDLPYWGSARLPDGEPPAVLKMATPTVGWALSRTRQQLARTLDGGLTWVQLQLPPQVRTVDLRSSPWPAEPAAGTIPPFPTPLTQTTVVEGAGFDACELPSRRLLDTWRAGQSVQDGQPVYRWGDACLCQCHAGARPAE